MITILYNQNDYEAASIALKAQSLAQNSSVEKIYIVPKHFGRNNTEVSGNLAKTKVAIFISYDALKIDPMTKKELDALNNNKSLIHFIIPNKFNENLLTSFKIKTINKYHGNNKAQIITDLSNTISNFSSKKTGKQSDSSDSSGALVLVGLVLLLLGLAATSGSKK